MRIAIVALLTALHVLACVSLGPGAVGTWIVSAHLLAKLLAAAGCAAAAVTLPRRDVARWFWAPVAVCYLLLAVMEAPVAQALALGNSDAAVVVTAVSLIAANVLSVLAGGVLVWLFQQRPTLAGLGAYLLAAILAAAVVNHGFQGELQLALTTGGLTPWAGAISYVADGISFVLFVPVVRHALKLATAPEARPWWAYLASVAAWLLFSSLERVNSPTGLSALVPSEALRTAATLLAGLAGLYQRDLAPLRRREQAGRAEVA